MSNGFDPYLQWLGIPPAEQPPHHYRLLGVRMFENNAQAIDQAADARMTQLRAAQIGPNAVLSQRLLNEVAGARACLLNPRRRAAYDTELKRRFGERQIAAAPAPASQGGLQPLAAPVDGGLTDFDLASLPRLKSADPLSPAMVGADAYGAPPGYPHPHQGRYPNSSYPPYAAPTDPQVSQRAVVLLLAAGVGLLLAGLAALVLVMVFFTWSSFDTSVAADGDSQPDNAVSQGDGTDKALPVADANVDGAAANGGTSLGTRPDEGGVSGAAPSGTGRPSGSLREQYVVTGLSQRDSFPTSRGGGSMFALSHNGQWLALVSEDRNSIEVYDTSSTVIVRTLKFDGSAVMAIAYSPTANELAVALLDGTLHLVKSDGSEVTLIDDHKLIRTVAFAPDGQSIAAGGDMIWTVRLASQTVRSKSISDSIRHKLKYSPDGNGVYLFQPSRNAWFGQTPPPPLAQPPDGDTWPVDWSEQGDLVALYSSDRSDVVTIVDAKTRQAVCEIGDMQSATTRDQLRFVPDSTTVVYYDGGNFVLVQPDDAAAEQRVPLSDMSGFAVSADGRTLAARTGTDAAPQLAFFSVERRPR